MPSRPACGPAGTYSSSTGQKTPGAEPSQRRVGRPFASSSPVRGLLVVDQALFIEQEIERWLGIVDSAVGGEVDDG